MRNISTYTSPSSYAAFISYRHLPRDAEVACEVQRAIEEYRLPRHVARTNATTDTTPHTANALAEISPRAKGVPTRNITQVEDTRSSQKRKVSRILGKCFRDEDELAASPSLPDSIREALAASRTLIVICSPETQESPWVRREIEMFEQLHGRECIICVLAAGSPAESIPPFLKTRMVPDVNGVLREMPAEPLAADLRPEAKAKHKAELLRIVAAVAGCNYDDLRQRERARKRKRIALTSAAAALIIAAIGVFAFQFHQTNDAALIAESKNLANQALEQYAHGEHLEAIETALRALPASEDDTSRPLVPEAQAALEKVLGINPDPEQPWVPLYLFDAEEEIIDIAFSLEGGWAAILDASGTVSVYDTYDGALLNTTSPSIFLLGDDVEPKRDWFIDAVSPSRIVMGNRTTTGGAIYANPLEENVIWDIDSVYPLASSPSENVAKFSILAYGTKSLAAILIDSETGQIASGAEMTVRQFPQSASFDAFCMRQDATAAYYGLGKTLVSFNLIDGSCRQETVADAMVQSVRSDGDIVVFTSSDVTGENVDINRIPFTLCAAKRTDSGFDPLWTFSDTFSVTVSAKGDTPKVYRNIPQIVSILHCKENNVVIATAGKKLLFLDLKTGEIIFQQEFNASVIAASPCFIEEDLYAVAFALSDGTLNIISPFFEISNNEDSSTTIVPYTLDGAMLGEDDQGNLYAFIRAAEQPNRIYCYFFKPYYESTAIKEFTLAELLDYAHQAIA